MPLDTPDATTDAQPIQPAASASGFAPLRIVLFRDRWIASTISSVGTWMQDTAGTWLMTTLTASPLLIALMQAAASLPCPSSRDCSPGPPPTYSTGGGC